MIATVINVVLILLGSFLGLLFKNRISARFASGITFALGLCVLLPVVLRLLDPPDVPVLTGLLLPYLLYPVGGLFSGLSLGRRAGVCLLYPAEGGLLCLTTVLLLYNYTALPHCLLFVLPALAGNLAGAALSRKRPGPGKEEAL